jgi:hypothetical protein
MTRLTALIRIAVAVLVIGLLVQMSVAEETSWTAEGQDVERQTVPTKTPTPGPVTPTTPPPTATDTPSPPPPVPTVTATGSPIAQPAGTTNPTTLTLPNAGGEPLLLWGGVLLLVNGALLLLAGNQARRRQR